MIALLIGLSACNAGSDIDDRGQHPAHIASADSGPTVFQASVDWSRLCSGTDARAEF
jgi:hypothetical protein